MNSTTPDATTGITFGQDKANTVQSIALNTSTLAITGTASMTEDGSILIDVLSNDTDIDTDETLNNIAEIDPVSGSEKEAFVLLNAFSGVTSAMVSVENNQIRFVPTADWNGINTFTYTFQDHWGAQSTALVTVDVGASADNPVANPDNGKTDEDTPVEIDLISNDTDVDIDPALNLDPTLPDLSADSYAELNIVPDGFGEITILEGPAFPVVDGETDKGTIEISEHGVIVYTPPKNWVGKIRFTYTVEDKAGKQAESDVFVLIGAINDPPLPPTFVTPVFDSYYKDGQTVAVSWLAGSDVDGDELTYVVDFFNGTAWTNAVASFTPDLTLSYPIGVTGVNTDKAQYRARAYDGFSYSVYAYSDTFIIDNQAPTSVVASLALGDGSLYVPGTWVNESVFASEHGGADRLSVEYWMGVDYGAKTEYMEGETMTISATGEYTVNFGTQDILENYRDVANLSVKIDKLEPIVPTVVFDHTERSTKKVIVTFDHYTDDPGDSGNKWIITPRGKKLLIEGGEKRLHIPFLRMGIIPLASWTPRATVPILRLR